MSRTPPSRDPILTGLMAEARYARERYDLYKAKVLSGRLTSDTRLRELRRVCESAERRLADAKAKRAAAASRTGEVARAEHEAGP